MLNSTLVLGDYSVAALSLPNGTTTLGIMTLCLTVDMLTVAMLSVIILSVVVSLGKDKATAELSSNTNALMSTAKLNMTIKR